MKNKTKSWVAVVATFLIPIIARAEDGDGPIAAAAEAAITNLVTVTMTVLTAALGIYVAFCAYKVVRQIMGKV